MSFLTGLLGFFILICALAWTLITAGVAPLYVAITSVNLFGIAVLTGLTQLRRKPFS